MTGQLVYTHAQQSWSKCTEKYLCHKDKHWHSHSVGLLEFARHSDND